MGEAVTGRSGGTGVGKKDNQSKLCIIMSYGKVLLAHRIVIKAIIMTAMTFTSSIQSRPLTACPGPPKSPVRYSYHLHRTEDGTSNQW